jgi:hypothetical protein
MLTMSQIHILAQRSGSDEWTKLIVFLVFLLISAVSGLIKRHNESKQKRERPSPVLSGGKTRATGGWRQRLEAELERARTETTQRLPRSPDADRTPTFGGTESPAPRSPAEPVAGHGMAKTRERERAAKKAVAEASDITKSSLQVPEPTPEPVAAGSHLSITSAPVSSANRILIDFSDPNALRRAVLQYEILGKPVGLRDLASGGDGRRVY